MRVGLVDITVAKKRGGWYAILVNGIQHGPAVRKGQLKEALAAAKREFAGYGLPQASAQIDPALGKIIAFSTVKHIERNLDDGIKPGEAADIINAAMPHVVYGSLMAALMLATSKPEERNEEFWDEMVKHLTEPRPEGWVQPYSRGWSRLSAKINAYARTVAKNYFIEGAVNQRWRS